MGVVSNVLGNWRRLSGLVILTVLGLLAIGLVPDAEGASSVTGRRVGGTDRYDTARVIAESSFSSGATFAVLATGLDFPDALAGSYLAGAPPTNGPVLLTQPGALSPSALTALQTLRVGGVFILGGANAVSGTVEQDLRARGYQVVRYGGNTRYDTARAVAESLGTQGVGSLGGERTAILVTGQNFADAVTGGPLSFKGRFPVLLTTPGTLSPQADQSLTALGIRRVLILGGTDAVSTVTATQVQAKGINVTRIAGANRRATAAEVARFGRSQTPALFGPTHVNLGRGDLFADSLSGVPHAAREAGGAPILLTESPTALGADTRTYLQQNNGAIESIDALGGPSAVSDAVLNDARTASTCTPTTSTTATTLLPTVTTGGTTTTTQPCVVVTPTTTGATTTTTTGPSTTTTTLVGPGAISCPPFPELICAPVGGGLPTTTSTSSTSTTSTTVATTTTTTT